MTDYIPDQLDIDWLNGVPHTPIKMGEKGWSERMEWRSNQESRKRNAAPHESHGWRDFFIGLAVMVTVILFAFYATRNDSPSETGGFTHCAESAYGGGC